MLAAAILQGQTDTNPTPSADELVKTVVQNEVAAETGPGQKHMFTSFKKTPKGTQTHLYVETTDAMAGMLIALNGSPLTPAQLQTEEGHLQWLEDNPDQLRRKHAREKEDSERVLRILKAMPYAFHYEYAGTEKGTAAIGSAGAELLKLTFTPNPDYQPPSRVEQVLTGIKGYVLVDGQAKRLAEAEGALFKDVEFGWGILGHLDKGGHFLICQADVGEGAWEITEMKVEVKGKILLFKSINVNFDEMLSDFRPVPEALTFAQGVQLLKAEEEKSARNERTPETTESKK